MPPPSSEVSIAQKASSGIIRTDAIIRGNDQRLDRRHADRAHGVDLLGDLHRADLRRKGRARAAGDHDRGHQHAELANGDPADKVDGVDLGAELGELDRALLGDDDADQEAHQPDDAERAHADDVEALDDRVDAEAFSACG